MSLKFELNEAFLFKHLNIKNNKEMTVKRLDARGYSCPHPLLKAQKGVEGLGHGDELSILIDNPPTLETIPRWAEKEGYETSIKPIGPGMWEISIRIP